ncbi:hypothetical protein KPH14_009436 [Odynerus spinipes]|uniref:Uncharacterized protein n=1 Tax=Odynerus spinipes TaxID=1348599 RepID=A0AAD9RPF1_9HYME|nr:hypothetical protein KPH14_009436 [Odynerus spinipes]
MINLYGALSNESVLLLSFLDELVRGINEQCETAIFLTTYAIDEPGRERRLDDTGSSGIKLRFGEVHESRKKAGGKGRKIFDIWSLHVILVKDERAMEQILNREASVHWTARLHFIVLIISDDVSVESDKYEPTIERVLKMLWRSRQILNVLLFVPFAKNSENSMYAYDPFVRAKKNAERGKVESINVTSKEDIFQRLSTLTHRRTNNMHGYQLNVALFEQFQSLMKMKETPPKGSIFEYSAGYNGVDGIILGTVAKYMNFKVKVVLSRDEIKYGHELPNGTYVGTLGDLVHGRADVAFVSFFVKSYGKSKHSFEFTSHTEFDSICVFVPKTRKIPKWLRIHHMFEPSIWFCSIISPIIVYLMCLVLRLFTTRR